MIGIGKRREYGSKGKVVGVLGRVDAMGGAVSSGVVWVGLDYAKSGCGIPPVVE